MPGEDRRAPGGLHAPRRRRRVARNRAPAVPGGTRRGWSAGPAGGASVEPRVTHFRPAASGFKGPNLAPNNNKTGSRAAAPRLQSPPSYHLLPPGLARSSPAAQLAPRCQLPPCPAEPRTPAAPFGQLLPPRPRLLARPAGRGRAEQQEGSGRGGGRTPGPTVRPVALLGAEGGGGGPRGRLSGTSARPAALSPTSLRPARRGRRVGALLRFSAGVTAGTGWRLAPWRPPPLPSSLLTAFFLSPPSPSAVPSPAEPNGARTWRGTLHPRPGPQTPPPPAPPPILLGPGNGLCIARGTCD